MPDRPHVLQLQLPRGVRADAPALRVPVHVGHPLALLPGREHVRPEVVPVGVHPHPAVHVQPPALPVGMPDHQVVLVDDEDGPLAVHALRTVVVVER